LPCHDPAATLVSTSSSPFPAPPSRNDPCPCGSGKRYKHCHGGADAAAGVPPPEHPTAASEQARTAARAAPAAPLKEEPSSPDNLAHAGATAHASGDLQTAEQHYLRALASQADHPVALHYLGVLRYQQGRLDDALPLLERTASRVPYEPEFHNNHGLALAAAGRLEEAVAAHERALALKPDHAGAWSNLGLALQERGDVDRAVAAFRRGLALAPDFPQLHWNLALALLLRGDYAEGWREYEWRLRTPELAAALTRYAGQRWTGDDPAGRTLLVTCEQGLGDTIQHLRFVAHLAARGARAVVVVPPPLRALAATAPGVAAAVSEDAPLPAFDAHVPLMSLPHALGIARDEDVAMPAPYLHADPARIREATAAIAREGRALNVGLAWSGAPGNTNNAKRSIPLASLAPLFAIAGVRLFSLKREGEPRNPGDAAWLAQLANLDLRNDFDGLAALVACLDVIVSVDTSLAHLAGAMGKDLWVPLALVPDWRWHTSGRDSAWYPTARLFRQRVRGDWSGPVDEIAQALRERVHRR